MDIITYGLLKKKIKKLEEMIKNLGKYLGKTTTPISDGDSTNPIEIDGEMVEAKNGDLTIYGSKEFIFDGECWDEIGDLSALGNLAYQDEASTIYTPAGTINAQAFTGTQATIEVEGTPEGTINSQAFTGDEATVNVTGTAAAQVFTGSPVNYTPAGTISGTDVTVSKTSINSVTSPGTLPSATMPTYTVSNEVLIISAGSFNAGSLPTSEAVSVATDIDTVTQPTFTGTQAQITAEGSNSASAVAASGTTTPTGTIEQAIFTGNKLESSGTYTPQGDIDQATFTGTQATITVS